MVDEWADHIAINHSSTIPEITFIHSKYTKKNSQGASTFHEVVSQALKNIGRTQAAKEHFKRKYQKKWSGKYENTQIKRIHGANSWHDLDKSLEAIYQNPNSLRCIALATPFLRKSEIGKVFELIKLGKQPKAHHIQLIWLLNTFISSCRDFGVRAQVLCRP